MSWPIGYGKPTLRYRSNLDGVIYANEIPVTAPGGWLRVPLMATASVRGGPSELSIRIRLSADAEGLPFLYAEQVECGDRKYGALHSLLLAEGAAWITQLIRAIHDEIGRAVAHASRPAADVQSRVETRPLRVAAPRAEVARDEVIPASSRPPLRLALRATSDADRGTGDGSGPRLRQR